MHTNFIAIGLSYKSTPLALREALSLTPTKLENFVGALGISADTSPIQEVVILSTCNRLEIYLTASQPDRAIALVIEKLGQVHHLDPVQFEPHLICTQGDLVIQHIMRVAAGLDSMVLGEPQILGQLVEAYQTALATDTVKAPLSRLCQSAIHTGKRVRTETAIGRNPASVSSVAVQLARQHLPDFTEQTVMVLGAGKMGTLTTNALIKQGVKQILVVSRSLASAEHLADSFPMGQHEHHHISAHTLAELGQLLPQTDAIITSTAATLPVLTYDTVSQSLAARANRPLLIVDIGLPRDVEDTVSRLPNIHLYDLDDLNTRIAQTLKTRETEVPQAEEIIHAEMDHFLSWYRARLVVPEITQMRSQLESVKEKELNRTLKRLRHLDARDQALVVELAHRITNKFLHHPTVHLKDQAANGASPLPSEVIQQLFGLEIETDA